MAELCVPGKAGGADGRAPLRASGPNGKRSGIPERTPPLSSGPIDASDRILHNASTGALLYDRDGSGTAAALVFATLDGRPAITAADVFVIA